MIVATGMLPALTIAAGMTTSVEVPGGTAFEHASVALLTTISLTARILAAASGSTQSERGTNVRGHLEILAGEDHQNLRGGSRPADFAIAGAAHVALPVQREPQEVQAIDRPCPD